MKNESSRRNFLAAGLALPVAGLASTTASPTPPAPAPQQAGGLRASDRVRPEAVPCWRDA